jgi:hypothetical protein
MLVMNDQLGLLLRREGLRQYDWSGWFRVPLKELSDLDSSWTILGVVIITTNKTRASGFALIPIVNRWCFGFLSLQIIFVLLVLTLSFSGFVFTGGGRLNNIYLRSLAGGRGRRRRILNIRRNGFGVVSRGLDGMRLGMESANHTVCCMRSSGSS